MYAVFERDAPTLTATSSTISRSLYHACLAAKACDDLRGKETVVLDLTEITPLFDYFVISTGNSRRQLHAISEEAERVLKQHGSKRRSLEGFESSSWIVQDFGDVVVHLFNEQSRALYDLEHLWGDARRIDWADVLNSVDYEAFATGDVA
jgi:ribosome-associated protein